MNVIFPYSYACETPVGESGIPIHDAGMAAVLEARGVHDRDVSFAELHLAAQVIDIVTLGTGPAGGGFLPNGLNGFFAANGAGSTGG